MVRTVSEPSMISVSLFLGMPIDAGCRLEVSFPQDLPLTNALTDVFTEGFLNTTSS